MRPTRFIAAAILLLCLTVNAWAIAYTSRATGNWSTPGDGAGNGTWNQVGVPGLGDTVSIGTGHVVTVTAPALCGLSDIVANPAITNNGQLIVNSGTSLQVLGSITCHGTTGANGYFEIRGDVVIDGQASGLKYPITIGTAHGTKARCKIIGTSGARASVTSLGSGTVNAYFAGGSFQASGIVEADYVDFTNIGDATNNAINAWLFATGDNLYVRNCTFTGCGKTRTTSVASGANVEFINSVWLSSLATNPLRAGFNVGTGTRILRNCRIDKGPEIFDTSGGTIEYNYCGGAVSLTGFDCAAWQYNLIDSNGGTSVQSVDVLSNDYYFDRAVQTNGRALGTRSGATIVHTGCVIDMPSSTVGDLQGGSTPTSLTATGILIIPNAAGAGPGKFLSPLANPSAGAYTVNHCTHTCTALPQAASESGLCNYGETQPGSTGMYASIKSNLIYSPTGKGAVMVREGVTGASQVSNPVSPASGADYNALQNPVTATGSGVTEVYGALGGYVGTVAVTNAMFTDSTGLGAHDIVANPQFVDPTRNLATFDTAYLGNTASAWADATAYSVGDIRSASDASFYGGAVVNFRCIAAHTSVAGNATTGQPGKVATWRTNWEFASLYRIRTTAYVYDSGVRQPTPRDLIEWVKNGFRPTNIAIKNAGHDGVTIGALEGVFDAGGAARNRNRTGGLRRMSRDLLNRGTWNDRGSSTPSRVRVAESYSCSPCSETPCVVRRIATESDSVAYAACQQHSHATGFLGIGSASPRTKTEPSYPSLFPLRERYNAASIVDSLAV